MKHLVIMVACTALLPAMVSAQSLQVKDCRTLEVAGNFIGPDEVMANGLVCKVVKANPTGSAAAEAPKKDKDSERRAKLALLGIIDTKDAKSQEPGAKPDSGPMANPSAEPGKSSPGRAAVPENNAGGQNDTIEASHGQSLGEVARAYQKASKQQTANRPDDQVVVEAPVTAKPDAKSEARTASAAPSLQVIPEQKTLGPAASSVVAPAETIPPKAKVTQTAGVSTAPGGRVAGIESQPAFEVKRESAPASSASAPLAIDKTQPTTKPAALGAEPTPEAKPKPSPEPVAPAVMATKDSRPELKAGSFDPQKVPNPVEKPEVKEAVSEPEPESASENQQEVKLGLFEPPKGSAAETKPQDPVDPFGAPKEDLAIHEPRPGCAKIVSLGSMENDRLVLATPDWALRWLEKNQKRFPGVCFADSPMAGVPSFLIVFFTVAPPASKTDPAVKALASANKSSGPSGGTFTTSFGSTWHYTYDNAATTTVTTAWSEQAPHNQPVQTLYAAAYTEQGIPISQHWPGPAKASEKETSNSHGRKHDAVPAAVRIMSDLLGEMMADLAAQ